MFYPIEGGSIYEVPDNAFGFIFKCWLPPVGYGKNVATGNVEKTDILCRSDIPEEQYWERPTLPKDYLTLREDEQIIQLQNKDYVNPYLEGVRKREWGRRLRGVWFWNFNPRTGKSELRYITGFHYFYITWWKFQGKYMDFRIPDMELLYVDKYISEDPDALGINEITKRKNGKTARAGCWGYERVSRMKFHHAGMQSKTDDDAQKAFLKAVIHPWKKLPHFFRPRYDLMKGDEPNELRFFPTARRGEKINEEDTSFEEPLESFFDYESSLASAYDGPELHTYVSDEAGKTHKPVSISERQNTTRYSTELDGVMCGKHWYTTTVEPDPGETENTDFQEMTKNSNPIERDANNRTGTGLYTIFLPAHKGMMFDKYGYPDEVKALKFINNTINEYIRKGDMRGLASFKRKNPTRFKDAFAADGELALYNPELINGQLDEVMWTDKFTERGNLRWKDGKRIKILEDDGRGNTIVIPSEVEWVTDKDGKFEKVVGWFPPQPNKVFFNGSYFSPNYNRLPIGCDPFKYDKTKDKRRSKCAAFAYQIKDPLFPTKYDDMLTLRYAYREESTRQANEDILMMAWWCGSDVLFERNVNHWKGHFGEWQCDGFLVWLPGEVEPGIYTGDDTIQEICLETEAYINAHIKKVLFKTLMQKETGWLGFKVEETKKFDEPMGAGFTFINKKMKDMNIKSQITNIREWYPTYRTN